MKKLLACMLMISSSVLMISCSEDDVVTPTDITITGIPATATVAAGSILGPVAATFTADAGVTSIEITKDGAAYADTTLAAKPTSITLDFEYATSREEGGSSITFVFTAQDADGNTQSVTHVLVVSAFQKTYSIQDISETVSGVAYPQNLVDGIFNEDFTMTSDVAWVLNGRVVVTAGSTLTIQAGTIIKGRTGEGALASALIVARDAQIMAEGTAGSPIIMTSVVDNINVGQMAGTNLDETDNGLWGGLLVLGNAPISADAEAVQIEGIPADETYGLYGGTVADDNSGVLQYVSIRHGGTLIGEGNEINGITLGGVGSGTTIDHVEIVANKDDGIEFFGGTVNVTNILIWAADDDMFDVDQAYSGTVTNAIGIAFPGTDHMLEIDGPEGATAGSFTITSGSFMGSAGEYADFRDGATGLISNSYFFNFGESSDWELDNEGVSANFFASPQTLNFTGIQINVSHLTAGNTTLDAIFKDDGGNDAGFNSAMATRASLVSAATVGATASEFAGWTYADSKGQLAGF